MDKARQEISKYLASFASRGSRAENILLFDVYKFSIGGNSKKMSLFDLYFVVLYNSSPQTTTLFLLSSLSTPVFALPNYLWPICTTHIVPKRAHHSQENNAQWESSRSPPFQRINENIIINERSEQRGQDHIYPDNREVLNRPRMAIKNQDFKFENPTIQFDCFVYSFIL